MISTRSIFQFFTLTILTILIVSCSAKKTINSSKVKPMEVNKEANGSPSDFLNGLTKATPEQMQNSNLVLGQGMPTYMPDGTKIESTEKMGDLVMSGEYVPEPYVDLAGKTKAVVLRKATAEESAMMKSFQESMNGESDWIGAAAPAFNVSDIFGNEYSLADLKGKVVILNFWFIGCKPCVHEMPELNKMVEKYKSKDVVFIAFGLDKKRSIDTFLMKQEFNYNIIPSSNKVVSEYKVFAFPTHFVLDKQGIVAYNASGFNSVVKASMHSLIDDMLEEE